ncbi:MAG: DUF3857 domain-containing protein [Bdellovibrionaceae bacterium]|nr:DUF3857 domain-containing protein [Pseudobdellovibrionaceae bacterium]
MKFFSPLLFLLVALISSFAQARLARNSEVPLLVKKLLRETHVAADGSSREKWHWVLRVQRPEAREEVGARPIRFYKNFEEVKVLRAGTRTQGQWTEMSLNDLQERAVTDESPGFSSLHEYILSFSDVQEGSEVEFEYEIVTKRALEPNFWGQSFVLDTGAYDELQWKIVSEKPLTSALQDPGGAMKMQVNKNRTQVLLKSVKPFSLALADEDEPYLSNQKSILMMAGFLSDWKSYGVASAKAFEQKAQGALAKKDEQFLGKVKVEKDKARRIQMVLKRISDRFRYFGDWRASEQMYVPRSLDEINRTSFGDCKDFALVAVKMLRSVGLEAKPVWVLNADNPPGSFLYKFPTDNAFNHVIVRVSDGSQVWWVDPTNPAARVHFLADSIAGRDGLVLDEKGSDLQKIRALKAEDYRTSLVAEIWPENVGITQVKVKSDYEGFSPVTSGEQIKLDGAKAFVQENIQRLMPPASLLRVRAEEMTLERESGNLRAYSASAEFENFWVKASTGIGFSPVREEVLERLRALSLEGRAGDIYLGKVYSHREVILLRGYRQLGETNFSCAVRSPWLDFEQKIQDDKRGLLYVSSFALKEPEIRYGAEEKRSVRKLQQDLRSCAGRQILLLQSTASSSR